MPMMLSRQSFVRDSLIASTGTALLPTTMMSSTIVVDDDDEHERHHQSVRRKYNRIDLVGPITSESCDCLNVALRDCAQECLNLQTAYSLDDAPVIELHLQSQGGELLPTLAVIDVILNSRVKIHSYIEGYAASAATLIAVVCHKRFAHANSVVLLHQLSGGASGKANQMMDEMRNVNTFMSIIKSTYCKHTQIPASELDAMLAHDIFIGADEMLEKGVIDEIV